MSIAGVEETEHDRRKRDKLPLAIGAGLVPSWVSERRVRKQLGLTCKTDLAQYLDHPTSASRLQGSIELIPDSSCPQPLVRCPITVFGTIPQAPSTAVR